MITLEPVGGAIEPVGGATSPAGGGATDEGSTLGPGRDLELSRTSAVLRSHSSAADNSALPPTIQKETYIVLYSS